LQRACFGEPLIKGLVRSVKSTGPKP